MPTQLPTDANQNPIQVLRLKAGAAHSIAATYLAARAVSTSGTVYISEKE